jgi:hypothetical protein
MIPPQFRLPADPVESAINTTAPEYRQPAFSGVSLGQWLLTGICTEQGRKAAFPAKGAYSFLQRLFGNVKT